MLEQGDYYLCHDRSRVHMKHMLLLGVLQFREDAATPFFWHESGKRSDGNDGKNVFMRDPYQFKHYPTENPVPFEDLGPVHKMVKDAYTSVGVANPDKPGMYWWVAEYGSGRWGSNPAQFQAAFKAAFANASKG